MILHANLVVPVLHVDAGVVDLLQRVQRLAILSLYAQNRRVAKLEALVAKYLIVSAAEAVLYNHFGAFLVGRKVLDKLGAESHFAVHGFRKRHALQLIEEHWVLLAVNVDFIVL